MPIDTTELRHEHPHMSLLYLRLLLDACNQTADKATLVREVRDCNGLQEDLKRALSTLNRIKGFNSKPVLFSSEVSVQGIKPGPFGIRPSLPSSLQICSRPSPHISAVPAFSPIHATSLPRRDSTDSTESNESLLERHFNLGWQEYLDANNHDDQSSDSSVESCERRCCLM